MANFFKKVGIEAKILEGKASGFKHEPLMKETLTINKSERHEIKELRQALDTLLDRGKGNYQPRIQTNNNSSFLNF
jgi:hypothetical protein